MSVCERERPENQNIKRMAERKKNTGELKFSDSIEKNHEMSFGVCAFFVIVAQKRWRYKMVGLHDIFDSVMLPQLIHNVHYKMNGVRVVFSFSLSFSGSSFCFVFNSRAEKKPEEFKR